jgi:BASS family bile acid:Na+ symporter
MEDNLLIDIGLPLVLAFVMVGIGLTLSLTDFQRQRESPRPVVVGLAGQVVVVPLVGFGIALLLGLPGDLAIGLVLLAATAGGTTSNVMTYLARGNVALSLVLTVVANLATILSIPFWATRALNIWGEEVDAGYSVTVGFMDVAGLLVALILIPTGLGMLIRSRRPALAARLERTVSMVSFIALFALIIGVVVSLGDQAWTMLRQAGPATLLLASLATAIGFGMGVLFRLPRPDHIALGMEFGIKNITLTMLLALTALGSEAIALPSAVYGVLAYVPGIILLLLGRRYLPQAAAAPIADAAQRPVVVGFDGSERTFPAMRWAAREAVTTGRPLRAVLAWGIPTLGVGPVSKTVGLDRPEAERVLQDAIVRLRAEVPGLDATADLVQDKPAQALLDRSADAALVVVGHRSRGQLGRLALGSVASAVVTHAAVPVVVVRGDEQGQLRMQGPVVVGVDGSAGSEAAVSFAMRASLNRGREVVAVQVGDGDPSAVGAGGLAATTLTVSPALRAATAELPAVAVREVVEAGQPAEQLVAHSADAALLVVGSRGHGGFAGLLLGSVSRAVVEQSQCPVAVLRTGN